METHFNLTDAQFEKQLMYGVLHPTHFTHQAHLRLAWIHIQKYELESVIKNINTQLKKYTKILGAQDKYNMTVTTAAIKTMYHFMLKSQSITFQEFISEFPKLQSNFKELLEHHYSFDIFNLSEAKETYIKPDLLSFE